MIDNGAEGRRRKNVLYFVGTPQPSFHHISMRSLDSLFTTIIVMIICVCVVELDIHILQTSLDKCPTRLRDKQANGSFSSERLKDKPYENSRLRDKLHQILKKKSLLSLNLVGHLSRDVCISIGCTCMQKHMYAEAYVRRSICTHTYFPRRIFLHLWREIRFSQTISHCTDIQPSTTKIFSNTYVM